MVEGGRVNLSMGGAEVFHEVAPIKGTLNVLYW